MQKVALKIVNALSGLAERYLLVLFTFPIYVLFVGIGQAILGTYYLPNLRAIASFLFGIYVLVVYLLSEAGLYGKLKITNINLLALSFFGFVATSFLYWYVPERHFIYCYVIFYTTYYASFNLSDWISGYRAYVHRALTVFIFLVLFFPLLAPVVINPESALSLADTGPILHGAALINLSRAEDYKSVARVLTVHEIPFWESDDPLKIYIAKKNVYLLCAAFSSDANNWPNVDYISKWPNVDYISKDRVPTCMSQIRMSLARHAEYFPSLNITYESPVIDKKEVNDQGRYLSLNASPGYYFHHYNAIAQPLFSDKFSIVKLINNQYGLGPLLLVEFAKRLGLTYFDSIYLSALIINVSIFIVLLFLFRKEPYFIFIALAYLASVLVPYAVSEYLAVMVFYIRVLPIISLVLYIFHKYMSGDTADALDDYFVKTLLVLSVLWNTEIGIIVALFFSWFYFIRGNAFYRVLALCAMALMYTKYSGSESAGGELRYAAQFALVSTGNYFDIIVESFIILMFYTAYFIHKNYEHLSSSIRIVFLLAAIVMLKLLWANLANHAGPSLFIFAILVVMVSRKINAQDGLDIRYEKVIFPITLFMISLILYGVLILMTSIPLSRAIAGVEYIKDENISQIFKVSSKLKPFNDDFRTIYSEGDIILSSADNMLAFLNKIEKFGGPYWDVSSSAASSPSELKIREYLKISKRSVIVSRDILEDRNIYFLHDMPGYPLRVQFSRNRLALVSIFGYLTKNNYHMCQESIYFKKYCYEESSA